MKTLNMLFFFYNCLIALEPIINDSFKNDDHFLVSLLVMGAIFFLLALIAGIVISFIFIAIITVLISAGLLSSSVLFGLYQKSISKGFKFLFISTAIIGCIAISAPSFWFVNTINKWWNTTNTVIIGVLFGVLSGYFIGLLVFTATKAMIKFLTNKYKAQNILDKETKKIL